MNIRSRIGPKRSNNSVSFHMINVGFPFQMETADVVLSLSFSFPLTVGQTTKSFLSLSFAWAQFFPQLMEKWICQMFEH